MDYLRPIGTHQNTTNVSNSRFICSIGCVDSREDVRNFLEHCRQEMPDASHHAYAFRIGYANSITEGMSDDGEPSGTAGRPILAVLRGVDIGDTIIVVTRYFGGTKLGTGGLVRAYTEAAKIGLLDLKTERKILKSLLGIELPYPLYEKVIRVIRKYEGETEEETFGVNVTIILNMPQKNVPEFQRELTDITSGQIAAVVLD
ncbi:MAG: YigZ family protein [Chloroflexota bacterium]